MIDVPLLYKNFDCQLFCPLVKHTLDIRPRWPPDFFHLQTTSDHLYHDLSALLVYFSLPQKPG